MLNMRKLEPELISDADSTSDGVTFICKRCCKANERCLKSYDLKQESEHI